MLRALGWSFNKTFLGACCSLGLLSRLGFLQVLGQGEETSHPRAEAGPGCASRPLRRDGHTVPSLPRGMVAPSHLCPEGQSHRPVSAWRDSHTVPSLPGGTVALSHLCSDLHSEIFPFQSALGRHPALGSGHKHPGRCSRGAEALSEDPQRSSSAAGTVSTCCLNCPKRRALCAAPQATPVRYTGQVRPMSVFLAAQ